MFEVLGQYKCSRFVLTIALVAIGLTLQSALPTCAQAATCPGGSFTTATNYSLPGGTTGNPSNGIGTGDFTGDGITDLVATRGASGSVYVLPGNGDGTFDPAIVTVIAGDPTLFTLTSGDFNGDSNLDLAIALGFDWHWVFLPGNGDGTFGTLQTYGDATAHPGVASGDFDGDSELDVVSLLYYGLVQFHHGNGDGTFTSSPAIDLGVEQSRGITAGYWNADSFLDLATANDGNNNVSILLGDGSGGFSLATPATYTVGSVPTGIKSSDLNGDADADLIVSNISSDNISILLGNGDGTFQTATNYSTYGASGPRDIVVSDFDNDGKPDIVSANTGGDDVSLFIGNGDGTFQTAIRLALAGADGPTVVTSADFDGNGLPDIATVNGYSLNASVLLNNCTLRIFLPVIRKY